MKNKADVTVTTVTEPATYDDHLHCRPRDMQWLSQIMNILTESQPNSIESFEINYNMSEV